MVAIGGGGVVSSSALLKYRTLCAEVNPAGGGCRQMDLRAGGKGGRGYCRRVGGVRDKQCHLGGGREGEGRRGEKLHSHHNPTWRSGVEWMQFLSPAATPAGEGAVLLLRD